MLQADKAYDIAGSILGDPNAALDEQKVDDALAELINTVAGHIMSDLVSAEQEFALGLPTVTRNMHVILDEPSMTYFLTLADACFQLMITGADLITLCNDHLPAQIG